MTEREFWFAVRQGLLTIVDAVERVKLNYGQPHPVTRTIKPTTGDLRKKWKKQQPAL